MSDKQLSPEAYVKAHEFLRHLRDVADLLTVQQMRTLRGQALSGDIDGAVKGLGRILLQLEGDP